MPRAVNVRRSGTASVLVLSDEFNGPYVQVDGDAEVVELPDAVEVLVEYFRVVAGEHPDWDEYRRAMVDQGKCVIRLTPRRWGRWPPAAFRRPPGEHSRAAHRRPATASARRRHVRTVGGDRRCGPAGSRLRGALTDADWFADEQGRLHRGLNRLWPRALGTTPRGIRRALSRHSAVPYRWRAARPRHDRLLDVREAVLLGHPVAMLVGNWLPRHWVLLIDVVGTGGFRCYEPRVPVRFARWAPPTSGPAGCAVWGLRGRGRSYCPAGCGDAVARQYRRALARRVKPVRGWAEFRKGFTLGVDT